MKNFIWKIFLFFAIKLLGKRKIICFIWKVKTRWKKSKKRNVRNDIKKSRLLKYDYSLPKIF
jgi:hypothetical protein